MDLGSANSKTSSESASLHQGKELTVLQKHVSFFDRNKDGIIYPPETFAGFRAIGCNLFLSVIGTVFSHISASGKTRPGKWIDLRFPIVVENIKNAMHGSDTGTYDLEGRFVLSKFEAIFSKHAHKSPNSLTSDELFEMLKENRKPMDFGGVASFVEWRVVYLLSKDKNGLLQKETIRAIFDGSLFEQLEKERSSSGKYGVASD